MKGVKCMISENLFFLRKQNKFSQEEVAEKIGVSRQAVAKWEAGDTLPDINNCKALAKLYDISLDDLVNYQSEEKGGLPIPPKGKYMFGTVTVGERGQIVIPVKARKVFDIKAGDDLLVLGDIEEGLALVKTHYILDLLENIHKEDKKKEEPK